MGEVVVGQESYFLVQVEHFEISTDGWTDTERNVIEEHRWWTLQELCRTDEVFYPEGLVSIVEKFGCRGGRYKPQAQHRRSRVGQR